MTHGFLVASEPSPKSADPDCPGSMALSEPVRLGLEEAVHVIENLVVQSLAKTPEEGQPAVGGG